MKLFPDFCLATIRKLQAVQIYIASRWSQFWLADIVATFVIFAASTSYELIGGHQNEPQWRRLNVEGLFHIIVAIPTILIIFFQISTKTLWYPGSGIHFFIGSTTAIFSAIITFLVLLALRIMRCNRYESWWIRPPILSWTTRKLRLRYQKYFGSWDSFP